MQQHKRISGILTFSEKSKSQKTPYGLMPFIQGNILFNHSLIHMINLFKKAQKWKHQGQDSSYLCGANGRNHRGGAHR